MPLGGRTLLAHALDLARDATGSAWIVGSGGKFAGFGPVVEDTYSGRGPLAGIQAALAASRTDLNLILAADMPFLQPDFLTYLLVQARASKAVVVVPEAGGGLQPLCATYRKGFAELAQRSLVAGQNKIDRLFAEVETRTIGPVELQRSGFKEGMFRNLNTEKDWEEARLKLSAGDEKGFTIR